jgi:hypothetical protein
LYPSRFPMRTRWCWYVLGVDLDVRHIVLGQKSTIPTVQWGLSNNFHTVQGRWHWFPNEVLIHHEYVSTTTLALLKLLALIIFISIPV